MRLVYLHLPRFPIQRKVVEAPSLRGRPFALVQDDRGVRRITFSSGAAQALGARAGMTLTAACARIPNLAHLAYAPEQDAAALASLGEALLSLGPSYEPAAPEGLWLDACAAHLAGGEAALAARVLERCAALGYQGQVAVASQKLTARALGRHGSPRVQVVAHQDSARALAVLPLAALEQDLATRADLASLGLSTLGEVAALPVGAVVARLGACGLRAQRLCRGEDDTAYLPAQVPEALEEGLGLEAPTQLLEPVLFALKTAVDRLAARLSGRRRAVVRLTVTLHLDPSGRQDVPLVFARPTAQPRKLLELVRHRLQQLQAGALDLPPQPAAPVLQRVDGPVQGVTVRVDESCEDRGQQLGLGDAPEADAALEVVLSRLSTALGEDALFCAEEVSTHRPERAYGPTAFRPPARQRGLLADLSPGGPGDGGPPPGADPATALERPARLFSRPAALDAEVDATGALIGARLLGRRRKVTAVAGPERLCGEWWEEDAFSRDYYRVHFDGIGAGWVFRDGRDGAFYLQGLFD